MLTLFYKKVIDNNTILLHYTQHERVIMFVKFNGIQGTKINKPFERELKVIMSPDKDASIKDFTFIVSTLAPHGGCTDFHEHPESGELMIFLSGKGKAWFGNNLL